MNETEIKRLLSKIGVGPYIIRLEKIKDVKFRSKKKSLLKNLVSAENITLLEGSKFWITLDPKTIPRDPHPTETCQVERGRYSEPGIGLLNYYIVAKRDGLSRELCMASSDAHSGEAYSEKKVQQKLTIFGWRNIN